MSPLTRTFVREHRLDPEVFRRAAQLYVERFYDPEYDTGGAWRGGCCTAFRLALLTGKGDFYPPERWGYVDFLKALMHTSVPFYDSFYLWPVRGGEPASAVEHTSLTPRLIALELCALMVEDLSR